jgi:hypothetical protein
MSDKDLVIEMLRNLPEDVTLEEISEEVAILAAIRRGAEAAGAGRVVRHEEVKTRLTFRGTPRFPRYGALPKPDGV